MASSSLSSYSSTLDIHPTIKEKLKYFHDHHQIPNILFNGPSGAGKSSLLHEFIQLIYGGDKEKINQLVMLVNCSHGKGIKFIREELKFFAKTNVAPPFFKCIVLFNGDKLTVDAQSALRRSIELFSHSSRFFIVVEDKYQLLKPILSRFCEIYVPLPKIQGRPVNLYQYHLSQTFQMPSSQERLSRELNKKEAGEPIHVIAGKLVEKGFSGLDVITWIERTSSIGSPKKEEWLVAFSKAKKEIRNETLLIGFMLQFIWKDHETTLMI